MRSARWSGRDAKGKLYRLKFASMWTMVLLSTLAPCSPMRLGLDYAHKVVDHAVEYVNGRIHTNGLENFWPLLKRESMAPTPALSRISEGQIVGTLKGWHEHYWVQADGDARMRKPDPPDTDKDLQAIIAWCCKK